MKYILEKNNISLDEAFSENCRNTTASSIVSNELKRCNNIIKLGNFRELVKGHIDIFSNDTNDINDDIFIEFDAEQDEKFLEGEELLAVHMTHERNASLVAIAKDIFKNNHNGRLFCEICGFDFSKQYGQRGKDFIEVHHKKAISYRNKNEATKVEDLVMLCSNCHSIVHRKQPWLTMSELERIIEKTH